jgi:hypothetical protein
MARWLRSFRHHESAIVKLDMAIFEASLTCAKCVKSQLEQLPEGKRG